MAPLLTPKVGGSLYIWAVHLGLKGRFALHSCNYGHYLIENARDSYHCASLYEDPRIGFQPRKQVSLLSALMKASSVWYIYCEHVVATGMDRLRKRNKSKRIGRELEVVSGSELMSMQPYLRALTLSVLGFLQRRAAPPLNVILNVQSSFENFYFEAPDFEAFGLSVLSAIMTDVAVTNVVAPSPPAPTPPKRKIKIEDLYTIPRDEPLSPELTSPLSSMRDEIRAMYLHEYGRGLDEFFETTWYTDRGVHQLLDDTQMCQKFGGMLELFANTQPSDYEKFLRIPQIEARVTWMLLCLPQVAAPPAASQTQDVASGSQPQPTSAPSDLKLDALLQRLSVFETLIVNEVIPSNPLPPHSPDTITTSTNTQSFWSELGYFVTLPPSSHEDIASSLLRQRLLLEQRENRDVLYSMAVVRSLGPWTSKSTTALNESTTADGSQDSGDEERLAVAKKFIEDEASNKGTTQVVQRLCGMAVRSWAAMR